MAIDNLGRTYWEMTRDDEGHRNYIVRFKVATDDILDGPQTIIGATGLPAIGDTWGYGNGADAWAWCTPYLKCTQLVDEDQPQLFWVLEYKFTTRPMKRCNTTAIEDPLLEPDRLSGSFISGTREAAKDRQGNLIKTTSHEAVKVDFDEDLPTVRIEQNRAALALSTVAPLVNTLNDSSLWGLAKRKIKLSNFSWERKLYGVCTYYYTRIFDFEVNFDTFDRSDIPNKGKKLIRGDWQNIGVEVPIYEYFTRGSPDPNNPGHYIVAKDPDGNPTEYFLSPIGVPSDTETFLDTVEYYGESDFITALGIPSSL